MPRIWIEYLNFLARQMQFTRTRRTFDRALRALPVSQHDKIWKLYLKFVRSIPDCPDTVVRVYRRYLRLHPTEVEDYISFLVNAKLYEEAIFQVHTDLLSRLVCVCVCVSVISFCFCLLAQCSLQRC